MTVPFTSEVHYKQSQEREKQTIQIVKFLSFYLLIMSPSKTGSFWYEEIKVMQRHELLLADNSAK